jgi:hypothetical protein
MPFRLLAPYIAAIIAADDFAITPLIFLSFSLYCHYAIILLRAAATPRRHAFRHMPLLLIAAISLTPPDAPCCHFIFDIFIIRHISDIFAIRC